MAPSPRPVAAVVGAGVAGLVSARELALLGYAVTVFDAAAPGGRVGSHTLDGLVLDAGAESFATRTPAVADLAAELGLTVVAPTQSPAWLHAGPGRDLPLPKTGLLGIPGDPTATEVVNALGADAAARAAEDLTTAVDPSLLDGPVTLGRLVRERLGDVALETLVTPVVSGVHSADPDRLDADAIAPGLREALAETGSLCKAAAALRAAAPAGSAVAGVEGGMHRLVEALVEDLERRGVHLPVGTEVTAVSRGEHGGFVVDHATGHRPSGTEAAAGRLQADRLVIATEGPAAVDLLSTAVPALAALRPDEGAGVSLVTLVVDVPELDDAPRGSGLLVAPGSEDVAAKALTHATAKWPWLQREAGPGRHVVRLSYGRLTDEAARLADSDDQTLISAGIKDAATLLGVEFTAADVLASDVVRHGGALPMATPGHRQRLQQIARVLDAEEDLDVVGAWRVGTGLTAVVGSTRKSLRVSVS
ncbi:MAG: protoporphyrinogen/coproporphyrinogen oxidase [Galactobacter sp.]|uniref:protoporphyrinogen/coproporphyrinogen oxidase n=1 Tax=Galactobacter sp. TaxID=2676125 RepID=UPI0025C070AF|nr:FAD-dependent oxidoreductase [Galactobacter sp.]